MHSVAALPDSSPCDALIVGAGISGLLAAHTLKGRGLKVVVLDKARGVGGRMARRRTERGVFDHGAQYFTAHDPQFRQLTETWRSEGLVRSWATGFALAEGGLKDNGTDRCIGTAGMTTVAKHLAQGLDVRLTARVASVRPEPHGWVATLEGGERHMGRSLVLTPPVPQSLDLLKAGGVTLPPDVRAALEPLTYWPCLALLIQLSGPSRIPAPGGLWCAGEPLAWMADNQQKGVSPTAGATITAHAGPEFSAAHYDAPEAQVTAALLAAAAPWLGEVQSTHLHRWRYSLPRSTHPERCLLAPGAAPLVFAGDAFGGPRVEGAAFSGLAAAAALLPLLKTHSRT